MMIKNSLLLFLLVPASFYAWAEPEVSSSCAIIAEVATALEGYSKDDTESIAPSLISHLKRKYGVECLATSSVGTTVCKTPEAAESFEFTVRDQTKRPSNGASLSSIDIKPASEGLDLYKCFASKGFKDWSKNEVNTSVCVPTIWKRGVVPETVLFVDPRPTPSCNGTSNRISIALAKGNRPRPTVR